MTRNRSILLLLILALAASPLTEAHGFGLIRGALAGIGRMLGVGRGVLGICPVCRRKHRLPHGMRPNGQNPGGGGGGQGDSFNERDIRSNPNGGAPIGQAPVPAPAAPGPHDTGSIPPPRAFAPPPPGRAVAPRPPDGASLNPAGVGGNPSFQFDVYNGLVAPGSTTRKFNSCQGTLVKRERRTGDAQYTCTVATAAHCITPEAEVNADKEITIDTDSTVFGTAQKVRYFQNPRYTGPPIITNDTAVLIFTGARCESAQAPVVNPCPAPAGPIAAGTTFKWGSRWFKGLYPGRVKADLLQRVSVEFLENDQNAGIYGGDSGGAVLFGEAPNRCLAGVLSTLGEPGKEHIEGGFAGGASLAWMTECTAKLSQFGAASRPTNGRPSCF